ncbi:MAG TPA: DUF2804 family protein [Solirubrobacteraceae bacterium]
MPARAGTRPLKAWRYVGVYGRELMVCIAAVRIGPVRQRFWAVWDRRDHRLHERTTLGSDGGVRLGYGRASVRTRVLQIDLALAETAGIETICPSGAAYGWTRKQGGIAASGHVTIDGERRAIVARAVIDDTAAYYDRHTRWRWSAGVGTTDDGRAAAWNLVAGVNDPPQHSERTVWLDGEPSEAPASRFAADLSAVDGLRFHTEAVRERTENRVLLRSRYRQPFGTFTGELPGGVLLAEGFGVMEEHDVYW